MVSLLHYLPDDQNYILRDLYINLITHHDIVSHTPFKKEH